MTEQQWRDLAENFPLGALKTKIYQELCTVLKLREADCWDEVEAWLDEVEAIFEEQLEASALSSEELEVEEIVLLAEMFSSEGVEAWLEAFEQVREEAPDHEVLATAQRGQRYLLLVREMASAFPVR